MSPEELTRALEQPADPLLDVIPPPDHVPSVGDGGVEGDPGEPIVELKPEELETEPVEEQLKEMVDTHVERKRPREEGETVTEAEPTSQSSAGEQPPSTWKPVGKNDHLRWKSHQKDRDGPYLVIECELDDKLDSTKQKRSSRRRQRRKCLTRKSLTTNCRRKI